MNAKKITTEVETASKAELPAGLADNSWGASETIDSNDVLVSKIFHQQALSKCVQDGLASAGDWCDSLTNGVIAKREETLEVIVFSMFKKLITKKLVGTQYVFDKSEDVTAENVGLPYKEELPDGTEIQRNIQYNFFVLLPDKINELPYVISFMSTKVKAAKKLGTLISKIAMLKKPSAFVHFNLNSIKETGDKGTWFGVEITQGKNSTTEELQRARYWYDTIKTKNIVVASDDEESNSEVKSTSFEDETDY